MRVPAIVGAFPEPFLNGINGRRRPVRVECDDAESDPCRAAKDALDRVRRAGLRVVAGRAGDGERDAAGGGALAGARIVRGGFTLEEGPERSGVFARFARTAARSTCSTRTATWRAPCAPATARRWWRRCARAPTSCSGS